MELIVCELFDDAKSSQIERRCTLDPVVSGNREISLQFTQAFVDSHENVGRIAARFSKYVDHDLFFGSAYYLLYFEFPDGSN